MADPKPQDYANRKAWRPKPGLSLAIRCLVFLVPIAAAIVVTTLLGRVVDRGGWPLVARIGWMLGMVAVAAVVSNLVARQTERALPLSALCRLNLAFPEEAPNRVKLALRVGNSGRAEKVLEEFAREGLAADPHAAALQTIELISALNLHDRKTRGHAEKVRALSDVIAEELALPEDDRNLLRWASLLHDVGKISVPAAILNKEGKPTDDEWALLRSHPTEGEWRMAPLRPWLGEWARCVEEHHERFDGTGYPRSLRGDQMALSSRIVAIADSFEVMTATRSYKKPMSYEDARAELVRCSGTHFDPVIVRAFLKVGQRRTQVATGLLSSWLGQLAAGNGPVSTLVQTVTSGASASGGAAVMAPLVRGVQNALGRGDITFGGAGSHAAAATVRTAALAGVATARGKLAVAASTALLAASMGGAPTPTLEWSKTVSFVPEQLAFVDPGPDAPLDMASPWHQNPADEQTPPTAGPAPAGSSPTSPGDVPSGPGSGAVDLPAAGAAGTTTSTTATASTTTRSTVSTSTTRASTTTTVVASTTRAPLVASPAVSASTTTTSTSTSPAAAGTTTRPVPTTASSTTTSVPTSTPPASTTPSTTTITPSPPPTTTTPPSPPPTTSTPSSPPPTTSTPPSPPTSSTATTRPPSTSAPATTTTRPPSTSTPATATTSSTTTTTTTVTTTTTTTTSTTTTTTTPTNHVIVRLASPATGGAVDAVAVDASGVVYMLARSQHQVFRRTVLGVITPYAGTGANGFSGDGGPATAAALDDPAGLAVNGAGELYIADSGNRRIRKVSAAGIISTVAGTGANGSAGDGGPPALATFKDLAGIAVRPDGHLLLADRGARVVREIDFAGNTIRGVFGTGNPNGGGDGQTANLTGLTRPVDVSAYDGVFAVADDATGLLWEVTTDGIAHLLAGGGTGTTAGSMATQFRFDSLRAVAIMESGASGLPHDLLVVDRGTSRVWKLNRQTRRLEAYAGTGVSGNADLLGLAAFAELDHPEDIVSRAAGDYIADTGNDAVRFVFR